MLAAIGMAKGCKISANKVITEVVAELEAMAEQSIVQKSGGKFFNSALTFQAIVHFHC